MSEGRIEAPPVTYDRSDFDALLRQKRHPAFGPIMLAAALLTAILVATLTLLYLIWDQIYWRETVILLIAIGLLIMLLWVFPGWIARIMMLASAKSGTNLEQHFSIDDEGFRAESARGVTLLRWSAVHKIVKAHDRLFVFPHPHIAYVVPRRVFASDGEFGAFVAAVDAHWAKARSTD